MDVIGHNHTVQQFYTRISKRNPVNRFLDQLPHRAQANMCFFAINHISKALSLVFTANCYAKCATHSIVKVFEPWVLSDRHFHN